MPTQPRQSFKANTLLGTLEMAAIVPTAPLSRRWYNRWGATAEECRRALPGDEIVARPKLSHTRAITIDAPIQAIWPWLAQMGQGRGGLYSYDSLENLAGCDIHSVVEILPACQNLAVGDAILFGPAEKGFPGQVVVDIQPLRAIIMCGLDPRTRQVDRNATWAFVLEARAGEATRLLVRGRNGYAPGAGNHVMWHIIEPIAFVMERRMLLGIKARAEAMGMKR